MDYLTLEEIKLQCRIDADDTSEDSLLTIYGDIAEEQVLHYIQRSPIECLDVYGPVLPRSLKGAMLIMAAQLYKYREMTTQDAVNRVPGSYWAILAPYVKLSNFEPEQ